MSNKEYDDFFFMGWVTYFSFINFQVLVIYIEAWYQGLITSKCVVWLKSKFSEFSTERFDGSRFQSLSNSPAFSLCV